jgi:hypothetical protein
MIDDDDNREAVDGMRIGRGNPSKGKVVPVLK